MDNVDRMYRHLVRTIRSKFPQYLTQQFDVSDLYQTILPYRHHRRELGLDTNDDYEITLTELLTGARDYLLVDDQMRTELKKELSMPNPDPSAFKRFVGTKVALSPAALRSLEAGPDDPTTPLRPPVVPATELRDLPRATTPLPSLQPPPPPAPAIAPPAKAPTSASSATLDTSATPGTSSAQPPTTPSASRPAATPRVSRPTTAASGARAIIPEPGEKCRSCNETLPPGRPITFCPHCGQNLTTMNCPACGSELELGWKFCPICGRPANAT
ncbi:MAG TPA: zinc ribbon domain-containing protein [Gemmatimonadaceae bacterium]|jgi:hypothetical protein